MEYKKGLLSVVIPTYKRSDTLCRAIDSVLNQTYKDIECLVVNDNNPGDEYSIVLYEMFSKYKNDNRFHFVEQVAHKNGAAARNAGIKVAKGEYIAFLDDDDFWDENKANVQISVLESLSEDWGGVSCLMRLYKNGKIYAANRPYKDGVIHYEVMARRIGLGMGSLIIRRRALDVTGYFDENLRRFQDPQIFSYLTSKYKIRLVKRYLHNRDVSDGQNRASAANIISLHEAYFKSINPLLEKLPENKVETLKAFFQLENTYLFWRNGQRKQAMKFLLEVVKHPKAIYYTVRRIRGRFLKRMFINSRLERYK